MVPIAAAPDPVPGRASPWGIRGVVYSSGFLVVMQVLGLNLSWWA
ncbi:ABC transporter, partial [Clavibacter michiganensis]